MSTLVDTNGWHTVSAVTYADVNAAIAAGGGKPQRFDQAAPDASASAGGTFGTWSLALGGSGPDINMQIALTSGSITGPFGAGGAQASLPVAPCTFPIMVRAAYIPHTTRPSVLNLALDDAAPVQVGSPSPAPTTSFLANAALQELLQQWLTTNVAQFNMVFASVDLDAEYQAEGLSWLQPSYRGYAVSEPAQGATMANSVFAVLCLVDGAPAPTNLSYAVSPFAIPQGARAAFLLSPDKFLSHMLMQALPPMFEGLDPGTAANHFTIDNSGTRIINTTPLTMLAVQLDNGNTVSPALDTSNFTIQLDGTELEIGILDMSFEASPGIDVHLNYAGRATLGYDKTHHLLDLAVTTQTGSGSVTVSRGLQIAEIVLGVVASVGALVSGFGGVVAKSATAAVEGAAAASVTAAEQVGEDAVVAEEATVTALRGMLTRTPAAMGQIAARAFAVAKVGLATGFVAGLMPGIASIMKAVAEGRYESLPKITDLTSAAVGKTVIWPQAVGTFTLDTAQLNGALQFGLVPTPPALGAGAAAHA